MERFLLDQVQHVPLLLSCLTRRDVESLSSASRGLATSVLRDAFLRDALVVVPKCPLANAVVRGILAQLSALARHVAVAEPRHLALLRRLPLLSTLRVAPPSEPDDDNSEPLRLDHAAVASLHSLAGVVQLELDARVDELAGLLRGMQRLVGLELVVRSQPMRADALANLCNLRSLSLHCAAIGDLGAIGALTQLESLSLASWSIHDVSVVRRLGRLEELDLSFCNVVDLTPLASLHALCCLRLDQTPVEDVQPLAELPRLQRLSLARSRVSDLTPLMALASSLIDLDLSGCSLTRVAAVCYLHELESVRIHKTTWSNLSVEPSVSMALSCLPKVRVVDGRVTSVLTHRPESAHMCLELAALQSLRRLERLEMAGGAINAQTRPVALPQLVSLRIEWAYAREPDIPLAAVVHPRLRALTLVRMRLRSLANLKHAPQLQELRLIDVVMEDLSTVQWAPNLLRFEHSCAMVAADIRDDGDNELPRGRPPMLDLAPLAALTKLQYLDLSYSRFRDLEPLRALTELRSVDLSSTDADDVSPLRALPRLESIRLGDTEIAEFEGGAFCCVLRDLALPEQVDCRAIRASAPLLRRLLHPRRDCLWTGHAD